MIKTKLFFKILLIFLPFFLIGNIAASIEALKKTKIKYRTYFGRCPSRVAGALTLSLVREFEKRSLLSDVKKKILNEKLISKHFVSTYEIKFNPVKKFLDIKLDCPLPLMRVQIYKRDGQDSYEALLVDNGKLFDPTYEEILENDKKLQYNLPSLAIPVEKANEKIQNQLVNIIKAMEIGFRKKLSEVILSNDGNLTIILSLGGNPSSAFLGDNEWTLKALKLQKILKFLGARQKTPSVINLTNSKKVVVKFNDRF
jgi:hypothetical protein